MSRKLIVAIAVLSVAFIGSSFAAVENIKVSGDINTEVVARDLSMGARVQPVSDDGDQNDTENFIFSQVRLRFDADLTEGVSAVVRLINERIWGDEDDSTAETEVDLDLAYLEMKEFLYQPLTVVIGRQNLRYGNGLIIGDPDTNRVVAAKVDNELGDLSLRKSFDAVKAILDYAPYTIDLIYAKIEENILDTRDDVTVVGANIAYDWSSYNGITEAYVFWTQDRGTVSQIQEDNEDRTVAFGARTQFDPNDNLTLGLEGALQLGDSYDATNVVSRDREAFAVQAMAEYKFLDEKNSKVGVSYTYLSGDNDSGDSEDNAWDSLFEDQSPAEILNILMPNTNLQYVTVSASCMPKEDLTVGLLYAHARLAEDYSGGDSLNTDDVGLTPISQSPIAEEAYYIHDNEDHIGDEIDLWGVYDYTEDVQLKACGAIFMPGDLFQSANDSTAYSLRVGANVDF